MKHVIPLLIMFWALNQSSTAQNYFNRLYDGPYSFSSVIAVDSTYIVTGDTIINANRQIVIVKLNAIGDTLWQNIYNALPNELESKKIISISNGFIITGIIRDTANAPDADIFVAKFDFNANLIWMQRYGGSGKDIPSSILQTSDNGFVVSGTTNSIGAGIDDFYLLKIDSLGALFWEQSYGGPGNDVCNGLTITAEQGYFLSGYSNSYSSLASTHIVKTDSAGNLILKKTFETTNNDNYGGFITQCSDGNFLLANSNNFSNSQFPHAALIKINPVGDPIWQKNYYFPDFSFISSFTCPPVENSEGAFVIGCLLNSGGNFYTQLLKTDPLGNILWKYQYYNPSPNLFGIVNELKLTNDTGFIFSGSHFFYSPNYQKGWIVKTDCFGCDGSFTCDNDPCPIYDCTQFPIDAFFTSSVDTLDLAFGNTVTFTNSSLNTSARTWNFGDEENGYTIDVISHSYSQTGTYTVSLIVYHGMCADTFSREVVVINTVGVDEFSKQDFFLSVYPNPSSGEFSIEYNSDAENIGSVQVSDIIGKEIILFNTVAGKGKKTINLAEFEAGLYLITLLSDEKIILTRKIIVVRDNF